MNIDSVAGSLASPRERDWAGTLFALALMAVGLFGITLPGMAWFSGVPGDVGDARFNSVVLEHLYRVLTGTQPSLWDPDFFYPFTGVLAYSDNHFGSGATYIIARLLGLAREHAFDVWYLVGVALSFAAALYALRRFGLDLAAAAVGAFIFTFGLPILAQDAHAQLVYRFGVPLATLALWRAFNEKRILLLAAAAFWTAWQFMCSIYLGIFLLYLLAALTVTLLLMNRPFALAPWIEGWRRETRQARWLAIAVAALSGLALAYLLGNYLIISRRYGFGRPIAEITSMLPRWASYFVMERVPFLRGLTAGIELPMRHEHQMFIGFAAWALVIVGIVASLLRRAERAELGATMFCVLAILIIGTIWVRYFSFYYLIAWLPGISSVRAVPRVIVVMLLPMGILAGIGHSVLSRQLVTSRLSGWAIAAVLAIVLVIEPLNLTNGSAPISRWQERLAAVRALVPADLAPDAILWVRTGSRDAYQITIAELDGMILAQDLNLPTLNGYSGYGPPHQLRANTCTTPEQQLQAYADFTGEDVSGLARRVVTLDLSPCEPLPAKTE